VGLGKSAALLVSIVVFAIPSLGAAAVVPNGSFEKGDAAPSAWKLSGGKGGWESFGHTGRRCISVAGDGRSSNYWKCPAAGLERGKVYRLVFWTKASPDATGAIVAGTNWCNFDWYPSPEWTSHSMVFRVPELEGEHYFRFGQWHLRGKVYFDDVSLTEIGVFPCCAEGLCLGRGEIVGEGRYEFSAPLGARLNFARPLVECAARFNTNRWLFGAGSRVVFDHEIRRRGAALALGEPRVGVNVGYYASGRCVVEASLDGRKWVKLGEIAGAQTAQFRLPREFDGAKRIKVALRGAAKAGGGKGCSFQVHGYGFPAGIGDKDLAVSGGTYFVRLIQPPLSPISAKLRGVGNPAFGGRNKVVVEVANRGAKPVRIVPAIELDGKAAKSGVVEIAAGASGRRIEIPYSAGRAGSHKAVVSLLDAGGAVLYGAEWEYYIPPLYDSGFGYRVASSEACDLWWAESPYKISRRCPVPERRRPVEISAAKGEYEPFQLVIAPKRDLRHLAVKASDLVSAEGGKIPAAAVKICRVEYVRIVHPTDRIGCAGDWPDPLPPCEEPFDIVAARGNQPLWITVRVPRGVAAGLYKGAIRLESAGWSATVPFAVRVWDFEIPRENHLRTAFGFSTGNVRRYHNLKSEDELRRVVDLYFRDFAEHRISPYNFAPFDPIEVRFPKTPDDPVEVDFTRFDRQAEKYLGPAYRFTGFRLPLRGMGGGTFHSRRLGRIGRWKQGSPEYEKVFRDYLGRLESHLRRKGWLDKAYVYWFDEPQPKDYPFVRDGMERIHRAAPGLRRMLTEEPVAELEGAVDIWCPLTPRITPEVVARERSKGREIWWYICTGPKGPYCTLFIDHWPIELRMWSWQTWKFRIQGLLIWETNYWTSRAAYPPPQVQNPWRDPMSYRSGYGTPPGTKRFWGNGDGRFFYPPNRDPENDKRKYLVGPVDSFRWEMLREGIEDYEYFWLLNNLADKARRRGVDTESLARAEQLLRIPDSIARDQTHFSHDPLDLYRYREAVAEAIVALRRSE